MEFRFKTRKRTTRAEGETAQQFYKCKSASCLQCRVQRCRALRVRQRACGCHGLMHSFSVLTLLPQAVAVCLQSESGPQVQGASWYMIPEPSSGASSWLWSERLSVSRFSLLLEESSSSYRSIASTPVSSWACWEECGAAWTDQVPMCNSTQSL